MAREARRLNSLVIRGAEAEPDFKPTVDVGEAPDQRQDLLPVRRRKPPVPETSSGILVFIAALGRAVAGAPRPLHESPRQKHSPRCHRGIAAYKAVFLLRLLKKAAPT
jgi:hypothetical protein